MALALARSPASRVTNRESEVCPGAIAPRISGSRYLRITWHSACVRMPLWRYYLQSLISSP